MNLTTSGAADTVAANCGAQGFWPGGTQNRDFDCRDLLVNIDNHPGPYYEMREAKFPRLRGPIR